LWRPAAAAAEAEVVITTVFCNSNEPEWRAELLEYSWGRARQPGELVRLVAESPSPPSHRHARVVPTTAWSPHPYTGDVYPPYQRAGGVLEWLFTEQPDGTILLVEPTTVFRAAVNDEVRPGGAKATARSVSDGWDGRSQGNGPFGLGPTFAFLEKYCVDRDLELDAVRLPLLIHSKDLRKIAARWLELMSLIRAEAARAQDRPLKDADEVAYLIAAAEAHVPHAVAELGIGTEVVSDAATLIDYRRPIEYAERESGEGGNLWDWSKYDAWSPVQPASAKTETGREVLTILSDLIERRARGHELDFLRPRRNNGVREGKILGSLFLEIPGRAGTVSLNTSGAAIWEACDGARTIADIHRTLEWRFEMPPGALQDDVEVVIRRLEKIDALRLEPV